MDQENGYTNCKNIAGRRYGGWENICHGRSLGGGATVGRTVEVYDPATDTWTRKADMSTRRWAPAADVVDGKIYVFGGSQRWANFPPFNVTPNEGVPVFFPNLRFG